VFAALASLLLTIVLFLPLSFIRFFLSFPLALLKSNNAIKLEGRRRTILIIGASHGIGRSILEQYSHDADTSIVAVARDKQALEDARSEIRTSFSAKAEIHIETLDIANTLASQVHSTLEEWQGRYGHFTHFYAVAGTIANVNRWSIVSQS